MPLQFLVDSKGLWYISLYATVELNKLQCPSSTSELRRESAPNPLDADALWIKHEQELLCYHKTAQCKRTNGTRIGDYSLRKFPQAPDPSLHLISIVTAIAIHASATYGDRRSPGIPNQCLSYALWTRHVPIRAAMKNNPRKLAMGENHR